MEGMKAKLVKEYGDFYLISDKEIQSGDEYVKLDNKPRTLLLGTTIATAKVPKLSFKNCQAIELGYDLDELAEELTKAHNPNNNDFEAGVKAGFQKALEILGGKKFTEEDIRKAYIQGTNDGAQFESMRDYDSEDDNEPWEFAEEAEKEFIQSLQQNEWEVEVVTQKLFGMGDWIKSPVTDADGCLILKRV
jgi:hypothetical protein